MEYEEVYEFGRSGSYTIDNSSSTFTATVTCSGCGTPSCTCSFAPITPQTLGLSQGQELADKLAFCIVCGAEESFVLCEVCVEAVKLARNRWLDEFREEIDEFLDE